MKSHILLLFLFLLALNCEGEVPLSEEELLEANRAKLYLTMEDDFNLQVHVSNFENVSNLQFKIFANDSNKFNIASYQIGDYTKIWWFMV